MKTKKHFRGLSGFDLKCLAMVLMVLDQKNFSLNVQNMIIPSTNYGYRAYLYPAGYFCSAPRRALRTPPTASVISYAVMVLRRPWA